MPRRTTTSDLGRPARVRAAGPADASSPRPAQRLGERPVVRDQARHLPGDTPHARAGQGLVYRVAVNRHGSRVVLTNARGRWLGALAALLKNRQRIDQDFTAAGLPQPLEWKDTVTAGRWVIRYEVDGNYQHEPYLAKRDELNRAAAAMKRVFDPYLQQLDPQLEEERLRAIGRVTDRPGTAAGTERRRATMCSWVIWSD